MFRMAPLPVLILVLLVIGQSQAQPKEAYEKENGWSAFDTGSWVVVQNTFKFGDQSKSKREKSIVASFEANQVNVAKQPEIDGQFVDQKTTALMSHRRTFEGHGFKKDKSRSETIEVAGKKLECMVDQYAIESKAPAFNAKIVVWRAQGVKIPYREIPQDTNTAVPSDAVRWEFTFEDEQKGSKKYSGIVEDFATKIKVGQKELSCVVERVELLDDHPKAGKSLVKGRVWLSEEVPGCEVKIAAEGEFMGKAAKMEKVVVEYVATKKK